MASATATATATASASAAAALLGYILLLVSLPYAFSLNGDPSKTSLNTYAGWKSFEVVTQGDKLGGYTVPGQMDGIGVSCLVFRIVCYFELIWCTMTTLF